MRSEKQILELRGQVHAAQKALLANLSEGQTLSTDQEAQWQKS
jgi:hypothetical protein